MSEPRDGMTLREAEAALGLEPGGAARLQEQAEAEGWDKPKDTAESILREIVRDTSSPPIYNAAGIALCRYCGDHKGHPRYTTCPIHRAQTILSAPETPPE